jgi:hypothetical protein
MITGQSPAEDVFDSQSLEERHSNVIDFVGRLLEADDIPEGQNIPDGESQSPKPTRNDFIIEDEVGSPRLSRQRSVQTSTNEPSSR